MEQSNGSLFWFSRFLYLQEPNCILAMQYFWVKHIMRHFLWDSINLYSINFITSELINWYKKKFSFTFDVYIIQGTSTVV